MADKVMTGTDYAKYLAVKLTDLEFETLIRERAKNELKNHWFYPQLNGSSTYARINICADNTDPIVWEVTAYINYTKYQSGKGEILRETVYDTFNMLARSQNNKLSKLLPPPPEVPVNGQDTADADSTDTGGSSSTAW